MGEWWEGGGREEGGGRGEGGGMCVYMCTCRYGGYDCVGALAQ